MDMKTGFIKKWPRLALATAVIGCLLYGGWQLIAVRRQLARYKRDLVAQGAILTSERLAPPFVAPSSNAAPRLADCLARLEKCREIPSHYVALMEPIVPGKAVVSWKSDPPWSDDGIHVSWDTPDGRPAAQRTGSRAGPGSPRAAVLQRPTGLRRPRQLPRGVVVIDQDVLSMVGGSGCLRSTRGQSIQRSSQSKRRHPLRASDVPGTSGVVPTANPLDPASCGRRELGTPSSIGMDGGAVGRGPRQLAGAGFDRFDHTQPGNGTRPDLCPYRQMSSFHRGFAVVYRIAGRVRRRRNSGADLVGLRQGSVPGGGGPSRGLGATIVRGFGCRGTLLHLAMVLVLSG